MIGSSFFTITLKKNRGMVDTTSITNDKVSPMYFDYTINGLHKLIDKDIENDFLTARAVEDFDYLIENNVDFIEIRLYDYEEMPEIVKIFEECCVPQWEED